MCLRMLLLALQLAGEIYESFLKYRNIASEYIMNAEWEIVRMRAMAIEKGLI